MAEKKEVPPHYMTLNMVAKSCRITPKSFGKWYVEPVMKVGRRNYYDIYTIINNRLERERERHKPKINTDGAMNKMPRNISLETERLREMSEKADNMALRNASLRGELAPIKQMEWMVSSLGSQIAQALGAIPIKIKRRCPHLTTNDLELIKEEIVKCQNLAAEIRVDPREYKDIG